ncbi:MAG TPA: hypothetical protein VMS65_09505, partial [Polyangiaceae bacterium]|nr:hypothetical protein [Polyangiaceae bacterium]
DLAIVPADSDFVSVSDTGFMGPRQADGSLPNLDFMKLSAASRLVDRGVDVGLPFAGTAPDLGCYETGLPSGGTGGASGGAGGASGGAGGTSSGAGAPGMGGVPSGGASPTGGTSSSGSGSGPVSGGGGAGPSGGNPSSGGTVAGNAGASPGAGAAPVSPHEDGAATDEAGCGCATPRRSGRSLAVTLAGLLFVALRVRRRRF